MKTTLSELKRIIREEAAKLMLEYEQSIHRVGDELYLVDDEGNEEYYGNVANSSYDYLKDGQSAPYDGRGRRTAPSSYGSSRSYGYRRRRF